MQFCWSTLNVRDMEASLRFYKEFIGLPIRRRFAAGQSEMAFLGEGGNAHRADLQPPGAAGGSSRRHQLGFSHPLAGRNARPCGGDGRPGAKRPFSPAPNVRFVFVEDPDGMRVQLVEEAADK